MMPGFNPADSTLTETPILPHDIPNGSKTRYIIQTDLNVSTTEASLEENIHIYEGNDLDWQSRLHGSAAALPLSDGTLIRSCGKFEEPNVIDVSKISPLSSSYKSALTSVEVDLSLLEENNLIGPIVSTRLFLDSHVKLDDEFEVISQDSLVKIVFIDVRGAVLIVRLAGEDFALPALSESLDSVELINTMDLLTSQTNYKVASPCVLTGSQVTFIDSDQVVLAMTSLLLCVNTDTRQVTSWRGGTCLEHRKQSLGGILKDAKRIMAGEYPSENIEEEPFYYGKEEDIMPSIACICSVPVDFDNLMGEQNGVIEESTHGAKAIISLHSDGSIRRWTLPVYRNKKRTIPLRMRVLKGADIDSPIPQPHTWSSTNDSLFLQAFTHSNSLHMAISVRTTDSLGEVVEKSPCHLTLLEANEEEERNVRFRELHVPSEATSLAGMDFSIKNNHNWELNVMFNTHNLDVSGVLLATYNKRTDDPTSIPNSFTIDKVAQEERNRMRRECNSFEYQGMEEIDSDFMKRLFRPMTLCISGRFKPSDGSIIRAFKKLVPSLCMDIESSRKQGSIEAKTVHLIGEWRRREEEKAINEISSRERKRSASIQDSTTPPSRKRSMKESSSVYRDFVKTSVKDVGANVDDSSPQFLRSNVPSAGRIQDRKRLIASHCERWKKLLFAVWDEETKHRIPLSIKRSLGNDHMTVIRVGVTSSALLSSKPRHNGSLSKIDSLDKSAIKLLTRLRKTDSAASTKLSKLEFQISSIISKAKLLLPEGTIAMDSLVDELRDISSRSLEDPEINDLLDTIQSMSSKDTQEWLNSPISSSGLFQVLLSPGLSFQNKNGMADQVEYSKRSGYHSLVASSAMILAHQFLESIQDLTLARFLLVCSTDFMGIFDRETALRSYLYATSILWVNNQVTSQLDNEQKESSSNRPKVPPPGAFSQIMHGSTTDESGLCFGDTIILLESRSKDKEIIENTVLYFQLLEKARGTETLLSASSISEATITLAKSFIMSTFGSNDSKLPELGGLFTDLGEKSRLGLRIVAPFVAYPASFESVAIGNHRKLVAADYLLAEVKELEIIGALDSTQIVDLQHCASELLRVDSPPDESFDAGDMDICLEVLRSAPNELYRSSADVNDLHESRLKDLLQFILDEGDSDIYEDAIQLSSLETARMLFMPWLLGSSQSDNSEDIFTKILRCFPDTVTRAKCLIKYTIKILLQASKSMKRLSILETHAVSTSNQYLSDSNAALLISAVEDVINIFQEHFSIKMLNECIVELSPLWSLSFRYSVLGQKWNKAFEACILNPSTDSKARKFQRLVLAMVENGFLYELIGMLNATVVKDMDLFELAAETLADAASHQTSNYASMNNQPINFCGSLLALHAAQSNWRRCSEAMNFYGSLSIAKLVGNNTSAADTKDCSQQSSLNERTINNITLAAVSSAILIKLEPNENHRFIVDKELSPYPPPATDNRVDEIHSDTDSAMSSISVIHLESIDKSRTSKLLTESELDIRALRMMAMKMLSMDSLSPYSILDIFVGPNGLIPNGIDH